MERKKKAIEKYIEKSMTIQKRMATEQADILRKICEKFTEVLRAGGKIYLCGNGGSAADAQHVAAELVGRFLRKRKALPVVAFTTDTSILTAIGNDYGFAEIFNRQTQALVTEKDILVGISTSGKSENVLKAIETAKEIGAFTIGFTGMPGEPLFSVVDLCLRVPCNYTPHIQESQLLAWHVICDQVEQDFCH